VAKKTDLRRDILASNEHLKRQLEAYQLIVKECIKVAAGMTGDEIAAFKVPPVELYNGITDDETILRVQKWWHDMIEDFVDHHIPCGICNFITDKADWYRNRFECQRPLGERKPSTTAR